jgi:uncharacterized membrane protein
MTAERSAGLSVVRALLVATIVCAIFYAFRSWHAGELAYSYLPWNLFLAWLPLGLTFVLVRFLKTHRWSSWPSLGLTILWLLFLPNSFYLVSDYIHLQDVTAADALYDAVLFSMFVFTGMLLGYASLYGVHLQLRHRLPTRQAALLVALVLFVCSFAMYIGRDLRRNSWDVLSSPGGLLFDISNQFTSVSQVRTMLGTIALFFAFLLGAYYVGIRMMQAARQAEQAD